MSKPELPTLVSIMTPFPFHIAHDASLISASNMMQEHSIRHLVVTRDGDISSILSARDLNNALALYGKGAERELLVDDICPGHIFIADIHDPLEEILDVMWEKRFGAAIVLKEGELAGIVTASDACRHFAELLRALKEEPPAVIA